MKKALLSTFFILICILAFTQVPEYFNYQVVVRDGSTNDPLVNQNVSFRMSILKGSSSGESQYSELHSANTGALGIVNLVIGNGTSKTGNITTIDWGADTYFLKVEIDPAGGSAYVLMGTTQLLSVPYALQAKTVASYSETDPVFIAHPANGITSTLIGNWNTSFGWGDHSGLYRPLSYVPSWSELTSNPFSFVSPASNQLLRYNTTSSKWENWTPDFITSFTEADPLFGAWDKSTEISISASQVSDFQSSVTNNAEVLANTAKETNATHTGDVTGSAALTLATVNSDVGTFNNITINAKGLATAGSSVSYLTSETDPIWTTASVNYYTKTNMQTSGASQLHFNNLTNTPTTVAGFGITDAVTTIGNQTIAGDKTFSNKIIATQQGIGTATPNAGAALEISSTTQGYLPPRMTQVQRDAITPVEGLIIYNTTTKKPNYYDGTEWKNYDGTSAKTLAVGDNYQGGKVAYILQSSDQGYVEGELHGLIAAPYDQSTGAEWGCFGTEISGADGTAVGTGNQNTIDIVTGCTTAGIAAKLCYDLTLNGYSDWYLPSKDELNKLCINKEAIGGFTDFFYWSSTESSNNYAWYQEFNFCSQYNNRKDNSAYYVRAVRAF